VGIFCRSVLRFAALAASAATAGFLIATLSMLFLPKFLNGSLFYAPALAGLVGLGTWHWKQSPDHGGILLLAAGIFAVSLTARGLDLAFCPVNPFGTHFLWHVLNGVVIWLLLECLIVHRSGVQTAHPGQAAQPGGSRASIPRSAN
jgi:hypothetical protein